MLADGRVAPPYAAFEADRSVASGAIPCGGGGNFGLSSLSSWATECVYVWESFRISAAAASRSPSSFLISPAESGSFRADSAAFKLASGSPVGRGIAAFA
ncbi:hypothetical protein [Streptomyces sp. NPDC054995]